MHAPDRALGMSRRGSIDSSAASGTSSIARKNQIANGKALKMPLIPNGRNEPSPAGASPPPSAMLNHRSGLNSPLTSAATKNTTRIAHRDDRDADGEAHRGLDAD